MAKTDYKSNEEYHQNFSGDILLRLETVRSIAKEIAPEAEEIISYQIPALKLGAKKYLIYYCVFPKHLSISGVWSEALLEHFKNELQDLKVSKSVIQFPHTSPLPVELIKNIIQFRKNEFEQ